MGVLALAQGLSQEELQKEILHTWAESKEAWLIDIHLGPLDLSINKQIWFLWLGAALTFFLLFLGARYVKNRPGAYQVVVEEIYGFGRKYLGGQMSDEGMKWMPYTLTLFIFLLTLNIIGLFPGSYPVTSNIAFTVTLAFLTLIIYLYQGIRRNGLGTYLGSFVPPNMPAKPIMVPLMFTIEALQQFITQPLTLAVRLYANILAGHLIIFVFLGLILFLTPYLAFVSVPFALVFYAFEIFVALVQAYIFAILTQVYIEMAMNAGDH
ncbi:MAG TPA: F0F1 ATP synthase subunit A [Rubrobacteraceae bacterium]|jgi:F-type H+-transporting ATPase subunit a|nr:F0F1 ATP synthase subunit A [Rubrobacteraceae bacterium]